MNRLMHERSAYLRHAARQKVDWYPWSEEAFEKARREGKPVFLSTGAVWCHWCHVMAGECFENDEIAAMMNKLFVNVKLDRDERPDIDRSYQQAVAAMGGGSGWPLSVFLTPEKEPFFGGTYFPAEGLQGRPGFKNVLKAVSGFYGTRRDDAAAYAVKIMAVLQPDPLSAEELSEDMLARAEEAVLSLFDWRNGGFGTAPKFPMPGAQEFLLRRFTEGHQTAGSAAFSALGAMAQGGFHDQLGGGFHRYSVDDAWIVPHFEKMADVNAALLENYIHGYSLAGDERLRAVATGTIGFTSEVLANPAGGFYASQDADVEPADEGGYFTWTTDELRRVLSAEEYEVISLHFLHERGVMPHDPAKAVLAVALVAEEIAKKLGASEVTVRERLSSAKAKLLKRRNQRPSPFVDTVLYASLNGMLIAAYLHAFMTLGNPRLLDFALKSLDRILRERQTDGRLFHAPGVPALLDDHVHLINALVTAYEATAAGRFLAQAEEFMTTCRRGFFDSREGGFFDTENEILGTRLKRIDDAPHPSGNAMAIMLLLKLAFLTGKKEFREEAEQSLRIFAGPARALGAYAGGYYCALDAYFHMRTLTVEAAPESPLAKAARFFSRQSQSTILYGPDNRRVIPCSTDVCYGPVYDAEGFSEVFKKGAPSRTPY